MLRGLIALWLLIAATLATPLHAQEKPAPALEQRARELLTILEGKGAPETLFNEAFLAQVPVAQVRAISSGLAAQNGAVQRIERITPSGPNSGTIEVGYERAVVTMTIAVEPQPPHRISGLRVTGTALRDDSFDKLSADFAKLPGTSSFAVHTLGEGAPRAIAGRNPAAQMAIGSEFKLYVLAELARQIAAGQHRWDEVVPLGRPSLPSGMTQKWPRDAPITLHSLATLMISISDNTATDTLIDLVERERVDAMVEASGHSDPARTLPLLRTDETFALKMPGAADLRARWARGDVAARRALLKAEAKRLGIDSVDLANFSGKPNAIDLIEWFASANDLAAILDTLRREAGEQALDILAVNPGTDPTTAALFDYIGYKGGSEPGVIALSYLVRDKRGRWFAVSGAWNDPEREVDNNRFNALMSRALALAAR